MFPACGAAIDCAVGYVLYLNGFLLGGLMIAKHTSAPGMAIEFGTVPSTHVPVLTGIGRADACMRGVGGEAGSARLARGRESEDTPCMASAFEWSD